jgi:glycosyltransferase involved in cell wall biosynthesis
VNNSNTLDTIRHAGPNGGRERRIADDPAGDRDQTRLARRVVFASSHSIVDFSNGASVATADMLQALSTAGFKRRAFCTPKLDFHAEVPVEEIVGATREPYQIQPTLCGTERARVLYTRCATVPVTIIRLESTRHGTTRREEVQTVLGFFRKFLDVKRPDVVLTYGGDPITLGMIAEAKQRQIPVVFALHNFAYTNPRYFSNMDYCIVASEFARRHYRDEVGLDCHVLAYPIDWERVRVERREPRFVTFVNPCSEKGVYAFARIAHELGRRRPDIPLLVVESRGNRQDLGACGLDLAAAGNVQIMAHTTDPRRFWGLTKIALLPSLWWENQPLVAIEATINGIPVIGSNRGGVPEALGESGFTLPLPDRLTPVSRIVPGAEEVEPWIETIIRLWDDGALYAEQSVRARNEAEHWHPDRARPLYAEFFRDVRHQPGAPVIAAVDGPGESGPPAAGANLRGAADFAEATDPKSRLSLCESLHFRGAKGDSDSRAAPVTVPISFVACVSDDAILKANLMHSPGLTRHDSPHQVILIHRAPSAPPASPWAGRRPSTSGSRASIRMSTYQRDGTRHLPSSFRMPSASSARSASRGCMASAR